jgi:hypothetical protein
MPVFLSRSLGDRILLAVFSPIVALMSGALAYAAHRFGPQQDDPIVRYGSYAIADFSFTFFAFSILVLIWALFTPEWIASILRVRARRVLLSIGFLVTGVAIGMIYFSIYSQ